MRIISLILSSILLFVSASQVYAYNIRIGLQTRVSNSTIGTQYNSVIMDSSLQKGLIKIIGMEKYLAYAQDGKVIVKKVDNNRSFDTQCSEIFIIPTKNNSFVYNKNRWYRGYLKLIAKGNSLNVVNIIEIEDYLKSVVPAEMPPEWSIEALKAQAIAARSYALANINKHFSEGYDLVDTTKDQVYKGINSEHSRSNYAVKSTFGQVIVSGNKIVPAYYHSSSGGITDNEGWSSKINFVRAVKDFDFESPKSSWSKEYSTQHISNTLSSAGYSIGTIRAIYPVDKTLYGRVKSLKLVGSAGTSEINSSKFQSLLGLPSNLFSVSCSDRIISISGRGSGHGIGMSQWGAKALADKGFNVYQILGYYFQNVEVRTIN